MRFLLALPILLLGLAVARYSFGWGSAVLACWLSVVIGPDRGPDAQA